MGDGADISNALILVVVVVVVAVQDAKS